MGNVRETFKCTEFPEDTISFDGHSDDDYILVEVKILVDKETDSYEYQNIGLSKEELIKYVEKLKGEK